MLIQGLLLVLLLPTQLWISDQFELREMQSAQERTIAVADGFINSANTMMEIKTGGKDVFSDTVSRALFIKRSGVSENLKELRYVRAKGTNDEFGEGLPEEKPVDDLDRDVLANGKTVFKMTVGANGDATLRAVVPSIGLKVFRDSKCLDCHGVNEGTVLGLVSVTVDIKNDLADITRLTILIWVGQIALQIVLFFTIGAVVSRVLKQLGAEPAEIVKLAQSIAQGDLCKPISLKSGDTDSMIVQLKDMQESLKRVVGKVRQGAEHVATASCQIAQGNSDLSARTERQASAINQTVVAMENLDVAVIRNIENAEHANQLALNATNVASCGADVVAKVVQTMRGINESSREISEIISVIDGIAFQTNILALNAAVEAARASEHGRGFAVVASEVRLLAGRSSDAAKKIHSLIGASVDRVAKGTALVDKAGSTMAEVVSSISRVTDFMSEITKSSIEQSSGISQVVEVTVQMDKDAQHNAALVEEMAAAAQSLNAQAEDLLHSVAVFKLHNMDDAV